MKNRFVRALRGIFHLDYGLTQAYLRYAAGLAALGYVTYHFIEAGMGYRDCWPLRIACILIPLPILNFPREGKLGWGRILYWEFTACFLLPFAQTYLVLTNKLDAYWSNSVVFSGLLLGLLTKPLWFIPQMVIGAGTAFALYGLLHGHSDAGTLKTILGVQANACLVGVLALAIQRGIQAFHRRGRELAEANVRAEAAKKNEDDIREANAELRRRETVITRFLRPSLFEELANGKDPTEFEPEEKDLGILFCDIRDFTHLTEILGPREKQSFLNRYLSMMTYSIVENGGEVDKIMGDCVMGIFPDGRTAVLAAIDMRLRLQDFNRKMFLEGKPKVRNGIGIAKGTVMMGNFGSYEKLDRTVIGEAVNIASRLESKTKMYNLEIVVTEDVIKDLDPEEARWRWIDVVQVKGSSRHLRIYEVYSHQPPEVRKYKDETRGLLEKALTIYFQKGFNDASRLFTAMLEKVPPHQHTPDDRMDDILPYYLDRCNTWIKGGSDTWDLIQKWQGVHVFLDK